MLSCRRRYLQKLPASLDHSENFASLVAAKAQRCSTSIQPSHHWLLFSHSCRMLHMSGRVPSAPRVSLSIYIYTFLLRLQRHPNKSLLNQWREEKPLGLVCESRHPMDVGKIATAFSPLEIWQCYPHPGVELATVLWKCWISAQLTKCLIRQHPQSLAGASSLGSHGTLTTDMWVPEMFDVLWAAIAAGNQ